MTKPSHAWDVRGAHGRDRICMTSLRVVELAQEHRLKDMFEILELGSAGVNGHCHFSETFLVSCCLRQPGAVSWAQEPQMVSLCHAGKTCILQKKCQRKT